MSEARSRAADSRPDGSLGPVLRCSFEGAESPGERRQEPVTCGVPWPAGKLSSAKRLALIDSRGRRQLLQTRTLDRWSDGSVRWVLLDWLADTENGGEYRLVMSGNPRDEPVSELQTELAPNGRGVTVDTGRIRARMSVGAPLPFGSVAAEGREILEAQRSGFVVVDGSGRESSVEVDALEIEEDGPVRTAIHMRGTIRAGKGASLAEVGTRLHFFSGSPTVRLQLTISNPRAAGHRGGKWSLGERGSIFLRDASLVLALSESGGEVSIRCSTERDEPSEPLAPPLEVYQDSSGGVNWDSRNHVNRNGQVPVRFRGYRLESPDGPRQGDRATPIVSIDSDDLHLSLGMRHFWQNFPKSLEASASAITLRLFPKQYSDVHEIQGGERKTHEFHIAFARDAVSTEPLAWCRSPLVPHAEPSWYASSGAIAHLAPRSEDGNGAYLHLIDSAVEGADTFGHKREVIDEYGWRNFGDLWADHERAFYSGPEPVISHYNNQYDAVCGFGVQFLRSADLRWFRLMDELARHVVDIDTYHTDRDKSAYNHGHFWHTIHYTDAGTSTHRSYPRQGGVAGGGPCGGDLYTSGLLLHWFLTGDPDSAVAVVEAGRFVIYADDGSKTIFRLVDRGYTGVISSSEDADYHGPSRNPALSIDALLNAHRVTDDRQFLDKAEGLIRRCIHPNDDLDSLELLDAERRWYYTMFLQTLGRHLQYKAEKDELDEMYAYARSALLHYASWAADNEYPYLEKPEILEFPTETWAAQDMRKSEVFKLAASHSRGELRQHFLERARHFFDVSVAQLGELETRSLCRPVVLLLSLGYSQSFFDRYPETSMPEPEHEPDDFGEPEVFATQKQRVRRKLTWLAATLLFAASVALAILAGSWC